MSRYDWLLFLHVLSAVIVGASLAALWALVLATRPAAPLLGPEGAMRFGRVASILVGASMVGAVVFGVWLAIDVDRYAVWDGWILGSLILWAFAGWAGGKAGKDFESDPVGKRASGIRLQAFASLAVLLILVLMIWKPGA